MSQLVDLQICYRHSTKDRCVTKDHTKRRTHAWHQKKLGNCPSIAGPPFSRPT